MQSHMPSRRLLRSARAGGGASLQNDGGTNPLCQALQTQPAADSALCNSSAVHSTDWQDSQLLQRTGST